ncbi:hypothetical protein QBC37DRAFT_459012 [Rhypophila decipiens]|uniref:Uncharacterized protein n=1 Tax=Rhypophila decipiens TaxID=261697 RepID=A0AAN7B7B7_9PEZI|nr:hypothetical protein QBC37DRAFT_459012 [Rhypophila decipiens]
MAMATNTTNAEILGWVQEPDGRGSFSILKSCVITLVLCVYTALHLNIPPANSTKLLLVWRKTKWIIIGLFAPEIVVFVAWAQRQQAEKDPSLRRNHEWTTTHSWFAYMGGFAIDTTYGQEDLPGEYIPGSPRITFHRKVLPLLARAGFLPDISRESILDKSKADALAKVLVVTQATWIILQCVMRLANNLPLTTLELTTLAHAICALLTYLCWWEKPLDIAEPILLTGGWPSGFASTVWVCNEQGFKYVGHWIDQASAECLKNSSTAAPAPGDISAALPSYSITVIDPHTKRKTTYDLTSREHTQIKQGQFVIADILGTSVLWLKAPEYSFKDTWQRHRDQAWDIALDRMIRWQLLRRFISDYPDVANQIFESPEIVSGTKILWSKTAITVVSDWTDPDQDFRDGYTWLQSMTVFMIAALVYGTIHAAAWNGHFASQNEALLWKISCIYVAGFGCLATLAMGGFVMVCGIIQSYYASMTQVPSKGNVVWEYIIVPLTRAGIYILDSLPDWCIYVAVWLALCIIIAPTLIFYLFCRSFLVIEGFIGLRSLPAEAFRTPDWTQYLPHL